MSMAAYERRTSRWDVLVRSGMAMAEAVAEA